MAWNRQCTSRLIERCKALLQRGLKVSECAADSVVTGKPNPTSRKYPRLLIATWGVDCSKQNCQCNILVRCESRHIGSGLSPPAEPPLFRNHWQLTGHRGEESQILIVTYCPTGSNNGDNRQRAVLVGGRGPQQTCGVVIVTPSTHVGIKQLKRMCVAFAR